VIGEQSNAIANFRLPIAYLPLKAKQVLFGFGEKLNRQSEIGNRKWSNYGAFS
jgi:hypothetical protein